MARQVYQDNTVSPDGDSDSSKDAVYSVQAGSFSSAWDVEDVSRTRLTACFPLNTKSSDTKGSDPLPVASERFAGSQFQTNNSYVSGGSGNFRLRLRIMRICGGATRAARLLERRAAPVQKKAIYCGKVIPRRAPTASFMRPRVKRVAGHGPNGFPLKKAPKRPNDSPDFVMSRNGRRVSAPTVKPVTNG